MVACAACSLVQPLCGHTEAERENQKNGTVGRRRFPDHLAPSGGSGAEGELACGGEREVVGRKMVWIGKSLLLRGGARRAMRTAHFRV